MVIGVKETHLTEKDGEEAATTYICMVVHITFYLSGRKNQQLPGALIVVVKGARIEFTPISNKPRL